jgi:membrane protein required for colicin V production
MSDSGPQMTEFTSWDWFVFGVVLVSTFAGLWRGLVRTVFAFLGWVAALVGAPLGMPAAIDALGMQAHPWAVLVGLFLAILVGMRLLGGWSARTVAAAGLGGADRFAGALLGVARALLVVTVVAVAGKLAGLQPQPAWRHALTRPLLDACVAVADPYLPQRLSDVQRI